MIAGGPHGAMGTLEGALQSVLGHGAVCCDKGGLNFLCITEPRTLEEATAHAMRELMLSHVDQRQALKKQVGYVGKPYISWHMACLKEQ